MVSRGTSAVARRWQQALQTVKIGVIGLPVAAVSCTGRSPGTGILRARARGDAGRSGADLRQGHEGDEGGEGRRRGAADRGPRVAHARHQRHQQ